MKIMLLKNQQHNQCEWEYFYSLSTQKHHFTTHFTVIHSCLIHWMKRDVWQKNDNRMTIISKHIKLSIIHLPNILEKNCTIYSLSLFMSGIRIAREQAQIDTKIFAESSLFLLIHNQINYLMDTIIFLWILPDAQLL